MIDNNCMECDVWKRMVQKVLKTGGGISFKTNGKIVESIKGFPITDEMSIIKDCSYCRKHNKF